MNDLVNMLRQSNIGIDITSQLINCLLFADDVVLMANSQDELQKSLQISHNCACKWNLRFNSKKSKVLKVIGKNLNKNSNWVLGNEIILGVELTYGYSFWYVILFSRHDIASFRELF
jgi:hypothetical protein